MLSPDYLGLTENLSMIAVVGECGTESSDANAKVLAALARAGLPLPSSPELRVFLSPRGALLLVRPGFGGPPEKIFWPSS